jgi:ADP-ribosylglycohydrolase
MTICDATPAVLVGTAIGDALGMPYESYSDEVHPGLADWDGEYTEGMHHKLPAGSFTDDTEMSIALAESLIEKFAFDPADVAARYLAWSKGTPHGMGGTTRKAMKALAGGKSWKESGVVLADPAAIGNGTAMRCAPLGVVFKSWKESGVVFERSTLVPYLRTDAEITHRHVEAAAASQAVGLVVTAVIGSTRPFASVEMLEYAADAARHGLPETLVSAGLDRAVQLCKKNLSPADAVAVLGRRGNAAQTVSSALYCAAYHSDNFIEGVWAAVRGGGDTDTRGAITGAVLGARNGKAGIPPRFLEGLHEVERLRKLDAALFALREATP